MGYPHGVHRRRGELPASAWLLYIANLLWTVGYDTYYAMVDRDDDLKIGVKSTAILFGEADRTIILTLQMLSLGCLLLAGNRFDMGDGSTWACLRQLGALPGNTGQRASWTGNRASRPSCTITGQGC